LFAINYLEGIQHELSKLVNEWLTYKTSEDYEALLNIYNVEAPRQIDELIELMRLGIREKIVLPSVSVADVVGQFDSLLNKPLSEQPLLDPVRKDFPDAVGEADRARFKSEITKAVEEKVLPGLRKLRDFIEEEYAKNTRPDIASSTLPTPGFYEACLKQHTGTELSPKQVHDLGLKEVARIQDEMRQACITFDVRSTSQSSQLSSCWSPCVTSVLAHQLLEFHNSIFVNTVSQAYFALHKTLHKVQHC
jgi:uncharacterized protein (DUF885 family)